MSNWKTYTLGEVLNSIKNGTTATQVDTITPYPVARIETIACEQINLKKVKYLKEERASYLIHNGDILYSNINSLGHLGKVAIHDGSFQIYHGMNLLLLRPNTLIVYPYILFLVLSSEHGKTHARRESKSAINQVSIGIKDLRRLQLSLPTLEVQHKIAEILTTVDNLIEQTEAAIAKYQSIKQGMMHDLFTRGVDANGQLRPPREEAPDLYKESELGWIPKEWDVKPLSALTNQNRPIVYGILMPGYGYPGGVPVVKVKDIQEGEINESDILLTSPAIDRKYSKSKLWPGDILFSIRGTVGRTAIVPNSLQNANITQDTARISTPHHSSIFIKEFMTTEYATRYTKVHTLGVAVQGINLKELRIMPTLVPLPEEQSAIGSHIQTSISRIKKENAFLQKLQLIKSGLMQDLLSGRVRVSTDATPTQEPPHAA